MYKMLLDVCFVKFQSSTLFYERIETRTSINQIS